MQYRLDERTATLPLFSFWKHRRPESAVKKVFVGWRASELSVSSPNHWIPYAADFMVFRALWALVQSGRCLETVGGYFEVKITDVADAISNPDAEIAKCALRISNTVYGLRTSDGTVERFKIMEAERKGSRFLLVRFPNDAGFSPVSVNWSTFKTFRDPTSARLFELVSFFRWMRHWNVSLAFEEIASAIPFDSGYMNRAYVRRAAKSVSEAWLVSFSELGKSAVSFSFSDPDPKRPAPDEKVQRPERRAIGRKRGYAESGFCGITIDSEMPKTDVFLRKALLEAYGYRCFYTREPIDLNTVTIDHVVPVSRWGRNCISNYVPVTKSANSSKNDRYDESDAKELVAVIRAVYARKVLDKYASIRASFYSVPTRV